MVAHIGLNRRICVGKIEMTTYRSSIPNGVTGMV